MKNSVPLWQERFLPVFVPPLARLALLMALDGVLILCTPTVYAQTDDFSDGNDTANPAWTHNSGYVASSGQSWTVQNGAYRLQAPNNGLQGFGYIGSFTGPSYTDVRVQANVIDFISNMGLGGAFGLGARLNSLNALGSLNGYGYAFEPFAAGLKGEMVLYRINDGVSLTDISSLQVTLDPAKDYTFVLEVIGPNIRGQVYEVGGGLVAENVAVDATYQSGVSGVFGYSQTGVPPTDFTIDDFSAQVPEPGVGALLALGGIAWVAARRWRKRQS